ncbi:MAG: AAA family ATPase [Akkermansia sp.]|nr:AAA family ATPase [Akkermansia sp.]
MAAIPPYPAIPPIIYLEQFSIPTLDEEEQFLNYRFHEFCTQHCYPFKVFDSPLPALQMQNITILYGGNGSGKTTLLNLMAEKLKLPRRSPYNRTPLFDVYADMCRVHLAGQEYGYPEPIPYESRFIGSDDVFEHILNLREQNDALHLAAERAAQQWKRENAQSMKLDTRKQGGFDAFLIHMEARSSTRSRFVRHRAAEASREYSNGESAFIYFTEAISERGLYLLDEPENSLSPNLQLDLVRFLSSSAVCGAQLVIATHSPLLLSIPEAKIYDLDSRPVSVRPWYELDNVRLLHDFFYQHRHLF